ncbi:hypothetical protein [Amycolatopsis sp. lyj-23]|uniref:hypothetical protein n=1 Tax=Amycolatopsis sp. lyj-23 TaxID=2789283 RepID=UPI003978F3D0
MNDNVAGIHLYATPHATCVQGRVIGPPGAEIWLDRCNLGRRELHRVHRLPDRGR